MRKIRYVICGSKLEVVGAAELRTASQVAENDTIRDTLCGVLLPEGFLKPPTLPVEFPLQSEQ